MRRKGSEAVTMTMIFVVLGLMLLGGLGTWAYAGMKSGREGTESFTSCDAAIVKQLVGNKPTRCGPESGLGSEWTKLAKIGCSSSKDSPYCYVKLGEGGTLSGNVKEGAAAMASEVKATCPSSAEAQYQTAPYLHCLSTATKQETGTKASSTTRSLWGQCVYREEGNICWKCGSYNIECLQTPKCIAPWGQNEAQLRTEAGKTIDKRDSEFYRKYSIYPKDVQCIGRTGIDVRTTGIDLTDPKYNCVYVTPSQAPSYSNAGTAVCFLCESKDSYCGLYTRT